MATCPRTHTRTHARARTHTHTHTIKLPWAGVQLVGHTSINLLCIAMRRNVLFEIIFVMAIREWVHMAWRGCIIRNQSEAIWPINFDSHLQ